MLFSPFRRTLAAPSFLLLSAFSVVIVSVAPVRAADFSSSPTPQLTRPFAPALEAKSVAVAPEFPNFSRQIRASKPNFAARALQGAPAVLAAIAPPPDGFYQTPAELQSWLLALSALRPQQVKTRILGRTPGGRALVALEITPPGAMPRKLRRLVILCRQHGNEPEASASGARFIREFLSSSDPKKRRIARKTALLIVVIANPDGAALYRRRTDSGVDMNRDWGQQKTLEVRLLTRWIAASKPDLVVDVHQWLPAERQHEPVAEASGGKLARQTAQRMARSSAARGYALAARSRWGLDTLCHRYWGQRFKIPAILLESRHRPNVPGAREVAIATSLTALWSAAETVSK